MRKSIVHVHVRVLCTLLYIASAADPDRFQAVPDPTFDIVADPELNFT